jgi:hypothetical protein
LIDHIPFASPERRDWNVDVARKTLGRQRPANAGRLHPWLHHADHPVERPIDHHFLADRLAERKERISNLGRKHAVVAFPFHIGVRQKPPTSDREPRDLGIVGRGANQPAFDFATLIVKFNGWDNPHRNRFRNRRHRGHEPHVVGPRQPISGVSRFIARRLDRPYKNIERAQA